MVHTLFQSAKSKPMNTHHKKNKNMIRACFHNYAMTITFPLKSNARMNTFHDIGFSLINLVPKFDHLISYRCKKWTQNIDKTH